MEVLIPCHSEQPVCCTSHGAPLLVCAQWFLELIGAAVSLQCCTTDCSSEEDFSCIWHTIFDCWC